MNQLTSLIEWLESEIQTIYDSIKIHVVSPTKVEVVGELNGHGQRPCFAEVRAVVDSLNLENYLDQESMIIMLQSHFEENDDRRFSWDFVVFDSINNILKNFVKNFNKFLKKRCRGDFHYVSIRVISAMDLFL